MSQLPDSLSEVKEYCSKCGRILGRGSSFVKATIEQVSSEGESLLMDCDRRYFCKECLRGGIYVNVKDPETTNVR